MTPKTLSPLMLTVLGRIRSDAERQPHNGEWVEVWRYPFATLSALWVRGMIAMSSDSRRVRLTAAGRAELEKAAP